MTEPAKIVEALLECGVVANHLPDALSIVEAHLYRAPDGQAWFTETRESPGSLIGRNGHYLVDPREFIQEQLRKIAPHVFGETTPVETRAARAPASPQVQQPLPQQQKPGHLAAVVARAAQSPGSRPNLTELSRAANAEDAARRGAAPVNSKPSAEQIGASLDALRRQPWRR